MKIINLSVICLYFILVPLGGQSFAQENANIYEQLNLFGDAFDRVRRSYVEEVSDKKLVTSAINGLLADLDPHSMFLTAEEYENKKNSPLSNFAGLGLQITMSQGVAQVVAPLDNSPAAVAGLRPGDLIVDVNRTPIYGMTLNQAMAEIKGGPPGSKVELLIIREGEDPFTAIAKREDIETPAVTWSIRQTEGYIRIPLFLDSTTEQIKQAVSDIKASIGESFGGLIIDLRNTPGGSIQAGIEVADLFLHDGEIVSVRNNNGDIAETFTTNLNDLLDGKPIVLLADRGTAGAAEIVTGAIKDNNRGVVVGSNTFGLGSRQKIIPVDDDGYVQITVGYFYSPSGYTIEGLGIEPEVNIEPSRVIIQESRFPRRREATLRGALDVGDDEEQTALSNISVENDYQLSRAFDLLRALSLLDQTDN